MRTLFSVLLFVMALLLLKCKSFGNIIMICDISGTQSKTPADVDPMLVYCWSTVYDAGPTLSQHWVDVLCFLGHYNLCMIYIV